jgi:hypothetical protein
VFVPFPELRATMPRLAASAGDSERARQPVREDCETAVRVDDRPPLSLPSSTSAYGNDNDMAR